MKITQTEITAQSEENAFPIAFDHKKEIVIRTTKQEAMDIIESLICQINDETDIEFNVCTKSVIGFITDENEFISIIVDQDDQDTN